MSKDKSNSLWWPRYVGDYQRKTAHLSLAEHGAYALLLDHYYSTGQPLPANASVLHRICRAFEAHEQAAVQNVIDQFFELGPDGYHNKKADEQLLKRGEISEKRKKAADIRYKKMDANASANADTTTTTTTTTNISSKEDISISIPGFKLPEWVPERDWLDWVNSLPKTPSKRALALNLGELEKLRDDGNDPGQVIQQTVMRGWTGFFPIKKDKGEVKNAKSKSERTREAAQRSLAEINRHFAKSGE